METGVGTVGVVGLMSEAGEAEVGMRLGWCWAAWSSGGGAYRQQVQCEAPSARVSPGFWPACLSLASRKATRSRWSLT